MGIDLDKQNLSQALSEASELLWENVEKSIWWDPYRKFNGQEKDFEKIRIQFEQCHSALVSFQTAFISPVLSIPDQCIKVVLQYGALRRLRSIYRAANKFADVAYPDRKEIASEDELSDLDDALMLIYVGIPAFFDALSVASFRAMKPKGYIEKHADIFSKKYLTAIDLGDLYDELAPHISWQKRVKEELRHRFAHRVPPFVPSATHGPDDTRRYEELQEEYRNAMEQKRFDELSGIMNEQQSLGEFCPWIFFHEENMSMPLQSTVLNDLLTFQVVALTIFERILKLPGFR